MANKEWFKLHAPEVFEKDVFGKTLGKDAEDVIGRTVKNPYSDLSGDRSKNYIELKLRIVSVDGKDAKTEIEEYKVKNQYLAKLVKKGSKKLEFVQELETKDGEKVRVKSVIITYKRSNRQQSKDLRERAKEKLEENISNYELGNLIVVLASKKLQKKLSNKINKLYPVRYFEVRKIEKVKE